MGHNRLGRLAHTIPWKRVIELLNHSANSSEIFDASLLAAKTGLERVPHDEGFTRTLTAIFELVDAFQSDNAGATLRAKGFALADDPTLLDYSISFKQRAESALSGLRSKSDLAEIAQNSFNETVIRGATPLLPGLFGASGADVEKALKTKLRGTQLRDSMHEFFVTFTRRYLDYHLSRELSNHVGVGRALASSDSHSEFNQAFDTYIRQTVRITDEFTPGWFGKARYEKRLSKETITKFAHVAFKKIQSEFERGAQPSE